MKKSTTTIIVSAALFALTLLSSCQNFLKGGEVKKEIEDVIAYNNAPSVHVYLKSDAEMGEFLSDGDKLFKVGFDNLVQFNVNQDSYIFENLEAVVRTSPDQSRNDSVIFTLVDADTKKGIYKINVKILEQINDIMIRPVCTPLPKISTITPALEVNGCNQDSSITINFNKQMNPASFKDENGKIKGISIVTPDGEDLSAYFEEPCFSSDNKSLYLIPLCLTDDTKYLLSPEGTKNTLNIEVSYTFVDVKDANGFSFTANGTHSYKINKNFSTQETVTVLVQNQVPDYGTFLTSGEKNCIIGFGFELEFLLNNEKYVFQGFKAVSKNNDESRADSVVFENEQYDEATGICKAKVRILKSASDILICPKCELITNINIEIPEIKGTKNITPAGKMVQSFINHEYSISFTPDEDYEFVRWEIYNITTDAAIPNGTYVTIAQPDKTSTTYEVNQIPETQINFGLRAIVAERPQIISNSPQNAGILKDSSIQVLFDHDMDVNSIYYTEPEVIALKESGIPDSQFLPPLEEDELPGNLKNHYGYTKNDKTYYKNILLTNNKSGANINDKFEAPFFENARTLSIPASKKEGHVLDHYTQVLVTIEKGFFYKEPIDDIKKREITLRGSKKWMYQVTNKGDTDELVFQTTGEGANAKPLFELKLENTDGVAALTSANASPTLLNSDNTVKSTLNFMRNVNKKPTLYGNIVLQDPAGGSGPKSTFTVHYQRIVDGDYTTPSQGDNLTGQFAREYTTTTSQDAFLDGTFDLDLPADGLYRIWFNFADRSNNDFYYPAGAENENSTLGFYVIQDTEINMAEPVVTDASDKDDIKLKLDWNPSNDWKSTKIRYRKSGGTWSNYEDFNTRETTMTQYSSLNLNTDYDFEIINTDYMDNTQKITILGKKTADYAGITINGIPKKTVYLKGESFDNSGLTVTAALTNGQTWIIEDTQYNTDFSSSDICCQGKSVTATYTYKGVSKTTDIDAIYYIAEEDALTQTPIVLTGYDGTNGAEDTYFKFGDYPQTIKASSVTISTSTPIYNGWYLGKDGYFYEKCTAKVCDTSESSRKCSDGTILTNGTVYYFKVEPIKWRYLNYVQDKGCFSLAENILTANIPFNFTYNSREVNGTTIKANNYQYSTIRAWLNGKTEDGDTRNMTYQNNGFLQKAFTTTAQIKIKETTVAGTPEKIFLLSNSGINYSNYGFDIAKPRIRKPTDYAIANEAYNSRYSSEGGFWWLRDAYSSVYSDSALYVSRQGRATTDKDYNKVTNALGIVPALYVDFVMD